MSKHDRGITQISGRTARIMTGTLRALPRVRGFKPFKLARVSARAHGGGVGGFLRGQRTAARSLVSFAQSAARSKKARRGGR